MRIHLFLLMLAVFPCQTHPQSGEPVQHGPALPNLSGAWELNLKMSKFEGIGFRTPPTLLVVEHSGAKVSMRHTASAKNGRSLSYVIDGKEHFVNFTGDEVTYARAYWDGNTLVIENHQQIHTKNPNAASNRMSPSGPPASEAAGGTETFVTSRYLLSADGKTLTVVDQSTRPPDTGYHAVFIYDKQ